MLAAGAHTAKRLAHGRWNRPCSRAIAKAGIDVELAVAESAAVAVVEAKLAAAAAASLADTGSASVPSDCSKSLAGSLPAM